MVTWRAAKYAEVNKQLLVEVCVCVNVGCVFVLGDVFHDDEVCCDCIVNVLEVLTGVVHEKTDGNVVV